MSIEESERIEMSRRERDRLKVLYGVVQGERLQKEAARLLRLTTRQVRRLVRRIEEHGDQGLIHRLRGRPSNRRLPVELRQQVLAEYRPAVRGVRPHVRLREVGRAGSADLARHVAALADGRRPMVGSAQAGEASAASAAARVLRRTGANGYVAARLAGRPR